MDRASNRLMRFDGADAIVSAQTAALTGGDPEPLREQIARFVTEKPEVLFGSVTPARGYECNVTIWEQDGNIRVKTTTEHYPPGTPSETVRTHVEEMTRESSGVSQDIAREIQLRNAAARHGDDVNKGVYDFPYAALNRVVNRMEELGLGRVTINRFLDALTDGEDLLGLMIGGYGTYRRPMADQKQAKEIMATAHDCGLDPLGGAGHRPIPGTPGIQRGCPGTGRTRRPRDIGSPAGDGHWPPEDRQRHGAGQAGDVTAAPQG